jgi:integrase/recombinase XerC
MAVNQFLNYLEKERRYSAHTIVSYRNDLTQLSNFLQEDFDLSQVENATTQMLRSWIVALMELGLTAKSVNRKISSAKSYYNYLLRKEVIEASPTTKLVVPKIKRSLPKFIKSSEMETLLDDMQFEDDFAGQRDRLIIEVLYACGLRLSELIGLRDGDFSRYESTLKVLGKQNKERIVPLHSKVQKLMQTYLDLKGQQHESPYIFLTDKGEKLYPKFVYRKVNHYLSQVTSAKRKSPHVLRHTFATHMLNNGADLNTIKEILGHANLSATEVYTHNTIEKLKSIYKQAHPRA